MNKKKLPIGIDDFSEIIKQDFYYVDKTAMITELMSNWGKANLFTRPRRFGKSLNMSMLKRFFVIGGDKSLFEGLAISREEQLCDEYMGQYPVISISLKGVEGHSFESARAELCTVIGSEAGRFGFLLNSSRLDENDKTNYRMMTNVGKPGEDRFVLTDSVIKSSLKVLCDLLQKHYEKPVVLLIDEYDVPLQKAYSFGYYDKMIEVIRSMFNMALKSNDSLFIAVLTGCLRISKESIFTGLNNLKMYTLLDSRCDERFGFTEDEVKKMLDYYGLYEYYDITKEWYDGYNIGDTNVYNPWDVINWCDQLRTSSNKTPKKYWANSSSNEELGRFIEKMGDGVTKAEIERLIAGETVQKRIEEQLTYNTIYDSVENLWSLLYATGYLTQSEPPQGDLVRLTIPNMEIRSIFRDSILGLFKKSISNETDSVNAFCEALKSGDSHKVESLFSELLKNTVSIRDTAVKREFKESFYHGILLGILGFKRDWGVLSNRESGDGYYDISVEIEDEEIGIVIEIKYAEKGDFETKCAEAMKQINDNNYTAELKYDGMTNILKYGFVCYRKQCRVVLERE